MFESSLISLRCKCSHTLQLGLLEECSVELSTDNPRALACTINRIAHSGRPVFLFFWDYIGIAWTCHYWLLRSLSEWSELYSSSLTSAITCVGGHLWKKQVFLLTVLPGLQDQHWRPHLCLHSTTASVWLTKGILFLGWYWARCRNTHWLNLFHHIHGWFCAL